MLLIRRFNTGSEDGMYNCAGGGIDAGEPAMKAMIRESHEELGIKLKEEGLRVVHIMHRKNSFGVETVGFFIEACDWAGEPCNKEPHKCDDIQWFDCKKLPDGCHPAIKHVFAMIERNKFFSEIGWE